MGQVSVYIDGYNVYRALKRWRDETGECLYWLDYWRLSQELTRQQPLAQNDDQLTAVSYYTALPEANPGRRARHELYIEAVTAAAQAAGGSIRTVLGTFQIIPAGNSCHACGATWHARTEKQSDTALCTDLVDHAYRGLFDIAIVLTSDSDMAPAMRLVKQSPQFSARKVILAYPPRSKRDGANFHLETASHALLRTRNLMKLCQLPNPVTMAGGGRLHMPLIWGQGGDTP